MRVRVRIEGFRISASINRTRLPDRASVAASANDETVLPSFGAALVNTNERGTPCSVRNDKFVLIEKYASEAADLRSSRSLKISRSRRRGTLPSKGIPSRRFTSCGSLNRSSMYSRITIRPPASARPASKPSARLSARIGLDGPSGGSARSTTEMLLLPTPETPISLYR